MSVFCNNVIVKLSAELPLTLWVCVDGCVRGQAKISKIGGMFGNDRPVIRNIRQGDAKRGVLEIRGNSVFVSLKGQSPSGLRKRKIRPLVERHQLHDAFNAGLEIPLLPGRVQ